MSIKSILWGLCFWSVIALFVILFSFICLTKTIDGVTSQLNNIQYTTENILSKSYTVEGNE